MTALTTPEAPGPTAGDVAKPGPSAGRRWLVAALVLTNGAGVRFLSGVDPSDFRAARASPTAILMAVLSVAIVLALLIRSGALRGLVRALAGDVPHLALIALFGLGAVLFAIESENVGPETFEGVVRYVAGVIVGVGMVALLGLTDTLHAVRDAAVLMSAASLALLAVAPELARIGFQGTLYAGVFSWNSAAGTVSGLGLILAVYMPRGRVTGPLTLLLRVLPIVTCGAVLLLSASRTAQFATAAALTFGLTAFLRRRRLQVASYFLSGAIVAVGLARFLEDVLELSGKDVTLTGRSAIWQLAWDLVKQKPLVGYGPGNAWLPGYRVSVGNFVTFPESAHNGLLELLVAGGLLAAIPVVLLVVRAIARGVERAADGRLLYPGVLPVFIMIAVLSIALSLLWRNGLVPAIFAAITAPAVLLPRRQTSTEADRGRV